MNIILNQLAQLCPKGVVFRKLDELCDFGRGKWIKADLLHHGEYPVVTSAQEITAYHNQYNRIGENITIASSGAYAGFISFWNIPFYLSNAFTVDIRNSQEIIPKFLFYVLKSKQEYIHSLASGGGVPNVYGRDLAQIRIPVPPLEIQNEIVKILDTFTKLEAELEAELEARRTQFEYYSAQIFEGQKYKFELKKLGDIARCYAGATPLTSNSEYWDGGTIPWIASGEVNKGTIYSADAFITQKGYESSSTKMVPSGSVLIALAGQGKTRGMVARTRLEACTNQSLCAIVPISEIDSDYLYFYMRTQYQNYRSMSSGEGGRGGLNLQIIKSIEVPVPSQNAQSEIVSFLEKFDQLTRGVVSSLPVEIDARRKQYEYYRNKLLSFKDLEAV